MCTILLAEELFVDSLQQFDEAGVGAKVDGTLVAVVRESEVSAIGGQELSYGGAFLLLRACKYLEREREREGGIIVNINQIS